MGPSADAPCMYGALQLLDEQGVQRHTYTIRKSTITLGRYVAHTSCSALSNDVRLLLEDVSREHCRIEFNEESKVRTDTMTYQGCASHSWGEWDCAQWVASEAQRIVRPGRLSRWRQTPDLEAHSELHISVVGFKVAK